MKPRSAGADLEKGWVHILGTQIRIIFLYWLAALCARGVAYADDPGPPGIESTYADHARAVELARAGKHDEALALLLPLLDRFPDEYPLQRDATLIAIWKGDCESGLARFERLRRRDGLEAYLIAAVGECLLSTNRPREAHYLLRLAHDRDPDDRALGNVYLKAQVALRAATDVADDRTFTGIDLHNNTSDQGLTEWIGSMDGSTALNESTRLYVRATLARSSHSQYQSGDLNRVATGIRFRMEERLLFDQEFSADVRRSGQGGSTSRLVFEPRDAWRTVLGYASYAELIPLRARAAGITADMWTGEVSWEARGYQANWTALAQRYDFSDTNSRTSFLTVFGYAWWMQKSVEHRMLLEIYASNNTLVGATYFNPARDSSIGLTHQTDLVIDSKFRRHVDRLIINANLYDQQGYGTHPRASLRYEQDYDFDASHALIAGAGLARNIYDGKYETERRFYLTYRQRL